MQGLIRALETLRNRLTKEDFDPESDELRRRDILVIVYLARGAHTLSGTRCHYNVQNNQNLIISTLILVMEVPVGVLIQT